MDEPKPKQPDGWNEAFDRQDDEKLRGNEKPVHVLNARQKEYCAHIKRLAKQEHVLG